MSFTGNFTCDAFKTALMGGSVDFTSDTFNIALYTNSATLDQSTTAYTSTGEVTDAGYVAGGETLTATVNTTDGVAFVTFDNVSWTGAITARGALVYQYGGVAVCVLDFGSDKTSVTTFTVQFPAATKDSALIRLS